MSIVNIVCRSVLSGHRSRLPLCIRNTFKWRNFAANNDDAKVQQVDNESNVPVQETTENYLEHTKDIEIRKSPSYIDSAVRKPHVDLTKSKGISVQHSKRENRHSQLFRHCLDESPDAEGFNNAIDVYLNKSKTDRRGHIDFIATGLKYIEAYGLEKESDVYDKLMAVFPREKFVNRTFFDAAWPQMHPQINLALDLLTKMEWQGLMPSKEMYELCLEIFGPSSFPLEKIERMWFWFSEYYDKNPYKLDDDVYLDRVDIIRAAIDRILGNNDGTKIVEISPPIQEEIDPHKFKKNPQYRRNYDHFIISSQTETQKKYIDLCDSSNSMYIEGPTHTWVNHMFEEYFIMKTGQGALKSPPSETPKITPNEEFTLGNLWGGFRSRESHELRVRLEEYEKYGEFEELKTPSTGLNITPDEEGELETPQIAPDEEREGVIVGICFATKPYNETLQRWLTYMQEENPVLRDINVVFDVSDVTKMSKQDVKVISPD